MRTTHELNITSRQTGPRLVHVAAGNNCDDTTSGLPSPELMAQLSAFCDGLKAKFTIELRDNALARKVGRIFSRLLLPAPKSPPGRPVSAVTAAALKLIDQGTPWKQIPWKVIPGFAGMSKPEQSFFRERLRRALYMRRKRNIVTNQKRVS